MCIFVDKRDFSCSQQRLPHDIRFSFFDIWLQISEDGKCGNNVETISDTNEKAKQEMHGFYIQGDQNGPGKFCLTEHILLISSEDKFGEFLTSMFVWFFSEY